MNDVTGEWRRLYDYGFVLDGPAGEAGQGFNQGELTMFGKQVFVSGMAAAVVFVGFALAPANADYREPVVSSLKSVGVIAVQPLTSPETPQDQVWDMTYGADRVAAAEMDFSDASSADEPIVDYAFG